MRELLLAYVDHRFTPRYRRTSSVFNSGSAVDKEPQSQLPGRLDKRIHVALPVRVTYWDHENKPCLELACTYDISARGARVTGLRCVKREGDIIAVERGRNRAFCRVVWIGEPNSELRGQVGLQCVESDRVMWEAELRDMEEVYDPIQREGGLYRLNSTGGSQLGSRRRHPRFDIEGIAELLKHEHTAPHAEAVLKDLSELGCRVAAKSLLVPGTDLKVVLNVANYDLAVRGRVRLAAPDFRMGIEFREIRKGDREILQFLLRKLAEKEQAGDPKAKAAAVSL